MPSQSMFSSLWHRVEAVKPRLRPQTQIERQVFRGDIWYVASGALLNRAYRMSPSAYYVVMRMNGQRTLAELWADAVDHFGDDAPGQDQIIQLVSQLYRFDLIQVDRPVDMGELTDRSEQTRRQQALQRFQNPMYLKLPLLDPNRFFDRTLPLVRPLFGWWGVAIWLVTVVWFLAEAVLNWESLTSGIADRVLATDNLIVLALVFPILKIMHELGHGYATKYFGGEVHEVGIMFLVFMPVPYVDASASTLFVNKWKRICVGAAGMAVELFVAAIAMIVWLSAEPGFARALAFNTMLIASLSTVTFNGNPLLRFDAYFILSDLIEIPTLAARANRFWAYLCQKYLLGLASAHDPRTAAGETRWFLVYAPASFAYRLFVMFGITLFVGSRFFFVGVLLALWTAFLSLVWPLLKMFRFVLFSPSLGPLRLRAVGVTAAIVAIVAALLFVVPVPYGTVARGAIWIPENARVYAEAGGEIVRFLSEPGKQVRRGDALIELNDAFLTSQRRLITAKLSELQARLYAAESNSPYETQVMRKQIDLAQDELAETERKFRALTIRSQNDGLFVVQQSTDLIGAYAKKGQLIGYVLPRSEVTIRAVVPEAEIETVETATIAAEVRLDEAPDKVLRRLPIVRAVPSASRQLPSAAFAQANGGPFATDPTAKEPDTSLLPFFELDVAVPADAAAYRWGERAWVRFDHGASPIAQRIYRNIRQLFLKRFNV